MLKSMKVFWWNLTQFVSILPKRRRFTREMILRIVADALMVNLALAIGLGMHYLWSLSGRSATPLAEPIFSAYVRTFLSTTWLLTPISFMVFHFSGFYTYGRTYRGRYKVLVILYAVVLSYLIFWFFLSILRGLVAFPRSVLPLGWFLTLAFLLGARIWIMLWYRVVQGALGVTSPPRYQVNNVLVIGGAGYIGSALTKRLLELGYHVRVLDLLLYGDEAIAEFYNHPNFELVKGDFRHIGTVVKAVREMDAVVHLGAIVGDAACQVCEELTVQVNLEATRTIGEVSKGFGVRRFVFASTCSVYGASDDILDELSSLHPLSLYARTKIESERVLLRLTDALFAPSILRFGTIYGLSGRPRFDLVVNLLSAKAIKDKEVGIIGGNQWRPFVHVNDVAEAIVLTLQAPLGAVRGQVFNVGSNEQNYQIADLGRIIQQAVPDARVVMQPQEDNRNYRVQFDKIRDMLHFRPQYTIQDGVAEIQHAFATGKLSDYHDPRYNNYAFLTQHGDLQRALMEDGVASEEPQRALGQPLSGAVQARPAVLFPVS